jgi:hypothetical protein
MSKFLSLIAKKIQVTADHITKQFDASNVTEQQILTFEIMIKFSALLFLETNQKQFQIITQSLVRFSKEHNIAFGCNFKSILKPI